MEYLNEERSLVPSCSVKDASSLIDGGFDTWVWGKIDTSYAVHNFKTEMGIEFPEEKQFITLYL